MKSPSENLLWVVFITGVVIWVAGIIYAAIFQHLLVLQITVGIGAAMTVPIDVIWGVRYIKEGRSIKGIEP